MVIVTCNGRALVAQCLTSMREKAVDLDYEIIVVDNNSSDGTPEMISREFPEVQLVRNSANTGFARACNQGMRLARGGYIALVNSDCYLLNNALRELVDYLEAHPGVGIVGARLFNPDLSFQRSSCRNFLRIGNELWMAIPLVNKIPIRRLQRDVLAARGCTAPLEVDYVSGALFAFRRAVWQQLGGLDERFFMYGEEEDFCRRAKAAGWVTVHVPSAQAVHVGGASFEKRSFDRWTLLYRSKLLCYRKHRGRLRAIAFRAVVGLALLVRLAAALCAWIVPRWRAKGEGLATEPRAGLAVFWLGSGDRNSQDSLLTVSGLYWSTKRLVSVNNYRGLGRRWAKLLFSGPDYVRNSEWRELLPELKLKPKMRVLDVGCGVSPLPICLSQRGIRVVCIDINPAVAATNRENWKRLGYEHLIEKGDLCFVVADAQKLGFRPGSFDRIYAVSSLEHIRGQGDHCAVEEMISCLKPDGRIVITVPFASQLEENECNCWCPYFERRYDLASLKRRLIPSGSLEPISVTVVGETFFCFSKLWYKLPFVCRFALGWLSPLLTRLFLRRIAEQDWGRYKAAGYAFACITMEKRLDQDHTSARSFPDEGTR